MEQSSIGDAADAGLAMMVVKNCENIDGGLPTSLRMKMVLNVIFDFLIGLVPFVGDVADAIYKCNTRNAIILEQYLREKGAKSVSRRQREDSPGADISLPEEFDRYDKTITDGAPAHTGPPDRSKPAKHARKNREHGRWFGGAAHPDDDLETGVVDNSRRPR